MMPARLLAIVWIFCFAHCAIERVHAHAREELPIEHHHHHHDGGAPESHHCSDTCACEPASIKPASVFSLPDMELREDPQILQLAPGRAPQSVESDFSFFTDRYPPFRLDALQRLSLSLSLTANAPPSSDLRPAL